MKLTVAYYTVFNSVTPHTISLYCSRSYVVVVLDCFTTVGYVPRHSLQYAFRTACMYLSYGITQTVHVINQTKK